MLLLPVEVPTRVTALTSLGFLHFYLCICMLSVQIFAKGPCFGSSCFWPVSSFHFSVMFYSLQALKIKVCLFFQFSQVRDNPFSSLHTNWSPQGKKRGKKTVMFDNFFYQLIIHITEDPRNNIIMNQMRLLTFSTLNHYFILLREKRGNVEMQDCSFTPLLCYYYITPNIENIHNIALHLEVLDLLHGYCNNVLII